MARGRLPEAAPDRPTGVISCEGGEMLEGSLERLAEFDDETRLRMIALTWNFENEIGCPAKGGSTEVCERTKLPPSASHSDCRWLCGVPRNLTREMVRAIIDRKGFIGVNFYGAFLREGGRATMDDLLRHIDALYELGAEDVIGFGSDFDGIDEWPEGIGNPSDFPNLLELLRARGYTQTQLEKLAGGNLWRVLKEADAARVC